MVRSVSRPLAGAVGLAALAVPAAIVDRAERLAFSNPEHARLRPMTIPIARLKGLLFVLFALRGMPRRTRRALAVLGLALALFPRGSLEAGLWMAYENGEEIEVGSWVGPATRLLGAIYVVVGLAGRADAPEDRNALNHRGSSVRPWRHARD